MLVLNVKYCAVLFSRCKYNIDLDNQLGFVLLNKNLLSVNKVIKISDIFLLDL